MSSKMKVLGLYKRLLRESQKFSTYNFRMYALRRVQDAFRENKDVQDESRIKQLLSLGDQNFELIRRQVTIGQLYQDTPVVLEKNS